MLDLVLGWAIIILPTVLAVVFIFIPARSENERVHMRWRFSLVAFGIGFSLLAWWQQSRALKTAATDRETAIRETSSLVATETANRVKNELAEKYQDISVLVSQQMGGLQTALTSEKSEATRIATGGDSICWLIFSPEQNRLVAVQRGKYPLHSVVAQMIDLEKLEKLQSTQQLTLDTYLASAVKLPIGEMYVTEKRVLDTRYELTGGKAGFDIFFSGLNGSWIERLRLRLVDGRWVQALVVTRYATDKNGLPYQKVLFPPRVEPGFPRSSDGDVEWY